MSTFRVWQRNRAKTFINDPLKLQEDAVESFDTLIRDAIDKNTRKPIRDRIACGGCSWCCYLFVTALPVEIEAIIEYIQDNLDFSAYKLKIDEAYIATKDMTPAERRRAFVACPFLTDGRCAIYPVRPLACAGYTSIDADDCAEALRSDDVTVNKDAYHWHLYRELMRGTNDALRENGKAWGQLELNEALHHALNSDDMMLAQVGIAKDGTVVKVSHVDTSEIKL